MHRILLFVLLITGAVVQASDRRTVQQRLAAKLQAKQNLAADAAVATQTDDQRKADLEKAIALLQAKESHPVNMLPVKATVDRKVKVASGHEKVTLAHTSLSENSKPI